MIRLKFSHFQKKYFLINEISKRGTTANKQISAIPLPLCDAMGEGISKLKNNLLLIKNYNVLVTILSDGEENASVEYSGATIKKMIEELKLNNWTFTYIGTDHDVKKFALSISITNTMHFDKTEEGIKNMFVEEGNARMSYSLGIRNKKNSTDDFYKKKK
jgi:hypothetical protein